MTNLALLLTTILIKITLWASGTPEPSFVPPPAAADRQIYRYTTPAFGFCARLSHCPAGDLWLEPEKGATSVSAISVKWSAPLALTFEAFEKHYKELFKKAGWKLMGENFDEAMQCKRLSAIKVAAGTKEKYDYTIPVRGLDVMMSTTGLDGKQDRARLIEYHEGVGKLLIAK